MYFCTFHLFLNMYGYLSIYNDDDDDGDDGNDTTLMNAQTRNC